MDLSIWLKQELNRRGWTQAELARQADVPVSTVVMVLQAQEPPDFEFCYRVAQALNKQPFRLLHLAGLLSDAGLMLALELTAGATPASEEIGGRARNLPAEERRLLLACLDQQPVRNTYINEVWLAPEELNSKERTQDRVRFAFLVMGLLLLVVGLSLAIGMVLVRL